ncbi:hypothetical protein AAF712_013059 [Marasmius tenuissimus]|uniref:Uncharacterized protein n=1 Tax=Marasmius tenuissimus TaxID=585030 RepID=A0ABR2ZEV8_9AGAR
MARSDIDYPRRVMVDDTDPQILYDTGWDLDGSNFNDFGVFGDPYNNTMRGTTSAKAGFKFTFEGDFVQVRGAKDNRKILRPLNATYDSLNLFPTYTCHIDGEPVVPFGYPSSKYVVTNLVLCERGQLSKARHTISMEIKVSDPNSQAFWIDSIEYSPLDNADVTSKVLRIDSSDSGCVYRNSSGGWETDNYHHPSLR